MAWFFRKHGEVDKKMKLKFSKILKLWNLFHCKSLSILFDEKKQILIFDHLFLLAAILKGLTGPYPQPSASKGICSGIKLIDREFSNASRTIAFWRSPGGCKEKSKKLI